MKTDSSRLQEAARLQNELKRVTNEYVGGEDDKRRYLFLKRSKGRSPASPLPGGTLTDAAARDRIAELEDSIFEESLHRKEAQSAMDSAFLIVKE